MKHSRRVVVWAYDLADAVALQYGMDASDFEIANLFWPGDFMNDCCKSLGIEEGCDDYDKEEAENGDEDAVAVYALSGKRLGEGLSVLIDILNPTQKTIEALMSIELPAGVEIEIKL